MSKGLSKDISQFQEKQVSEENFTCKDMTEMNSPENPEILNEQQL